MATNDMGHRLLQQQQQLLQRTGLQHYRCVSAPDLAADFDHHHHQLRSDRFPQSYQNHYQFDRPPPYLIEDNDDDDDRCNDVSRMRQPSFASSSGDYTSATDSSMIFEIDQTSYDNNNNNNNCPNKQASDLNGLNLKSLKLSDSNYSNKTYELVQAAAQVSQAPPSQDEHFAEYAKTTQEGKDRGPSLSAGVGGGGDIDATGAAGDNSSHLQTTGRTQQQSQVGNGDKNAAAAAPSDHRDPTPTQRALAVPQLVHYSNLSRHDSLINGYYGPYHDSHTADSYNEPLHHYSAVDPSPMLSGSGATCTCCRDTGQHLGAMDPLSGHCGGTDYGHVPEFTKLCSPNEHQQQVLYNDNNSDKILPVPVQRANDQAAAYGYLGPHANYGSGAASAHSDRASDEQAAPTLTTLQPNRGNNSRHSSSAGSSAAQVTNASASRTQDDYHRDRSSSSVLAFGDRQQHSYGSCNPIQYNSGSHNHSHSETHGNSINDHSNGNDYNYADSNTLTHLSRRQEPPAPLYREDSNNNGGSHYLHDHINSSTASTSYVRFDGSRGNNERPPDDGDDEDDGDDDDDGVGSIRVCEWEGCENTFIDMGEFSKHIEDQHVNPDPKVKNHYYCLWHNCKRNRQEFNARYKLLIHMRVHSGEKPYPCTHKDRKTGKECSKAFSRLENLKIHERSHTGEKPYKCIYPNCTKSFTNSSDRIKHHKTHVDEKPYACTHEGCTKRYTDPSSLRKHLRAHKRREAPPAIIVQGPSVLQQQQQQQQREREREQQQQQQQQALGRVGCPADFDPSAALLGPRMDCSGSTAATASSSSLVIPHPGLYDDWHHNGQPSYSQSYNETCGRSYGGAAEQPAAAYDEPMMDQSAGSGPQVPPAHNQPRHQAPHTWQQQHERLSQSWSAPGLVWPSAYQPHHHLAPHSDHLDQPDSQQHPHQWHQQAQQGTGSEWHQPRETLGAPAGPYSAQQQPQHQSLSNSYSHSNSNSNSQPQQQSYTSTYDQAAAHDWHQHQQTRSAMTARQMRRLNRSLPPSQGEMRAAALKARAASNSMIFSVSTTAAGSGLLAAPQQYQQRPQQARELRNSGAE